MILEGIVTTLNADGSPNISPMGPDVDSSLNHMRLRPFQTSTTYTNLKRTGEAVFHVVDDVELLARAAIGDLTPLPELVPANSVTGVILTTACRWYALRVTAIDDREPRAEFETEVIDRGRLRDFFGFNRAKHAVVEAAILATRVEILPAKEIVEEIERLTLIVAKTGGPQEHRAMKFLGAYIDRAIGSGLSTKTRAERPDGSFVKEFPMHPESVDVSTPSRLHCGMLAFGDGVTRQFGGLGIMIDRPRFHLRLRFSDRLEVQGPGAKRVAHFARLATSDPRGEPRVAMQVLQSPSAHIGLGSGTQMAMAVATGIAAMEGRPHDDVVQLGRRMKRGKRSSVGTHGFASGGMILEGGKRNDEAFGPLITRVALPDSWRFVLLLPRNIAGLSGTAEEDAMTSLPPVPLGLTGEMCRVLLIDLLPAAVEADFDSFVDGLEHFGKLAGGCFSQAQGGPYATGQAAESVKILRNLGGRGIAQSSWGPGVFCVCPSDDAAEVLREGLAKLPDATSREVVVAKADNHGAVVRTVGNIA